MAQGSIRKPPQRAVKTAQQITGEKGRLTDFDREVMRKSQKGVKKAQQITAGPKQKADMKRWKARGKKGSGWGQDVIDAVKRYGKTAADFWKAVGKDTAKKVKDGTKSATAAAKEAFESKPATKKPESKGTWDQPDVIGPNPTSKMGKRKKHIQDIMKKLERPPRKKKVE